MPLSLERQLANLLKGIQKQADRATKKCLRELAPQAVRMIKERTRKGKGLSDGDKPIQVPMPALAPSTIKRRKYKELGPHATPRKSNLNETGKMVSALRVKAIKNGFRIFLSGGRANTLATRHEDGNIRGGVKRRFVGFAPRERTKIITLLKKCFDNIF